MKVKIGDTVLIITGKDAGKKGKVIRLLKEKERVVIEKVNLITKHVKKTRERAGERIEKEAPIHVSNVMVISPDSGKPTRVRYETPKEGKKYRVATRGGETIERPFVKS